MAIDFPNSPTVNDTYTAGGKTWQWNGTYWSAYGTSPILRASDTAPLSPNANDLWYETDTGSLFAYVDGYWVELGASAPVTASAGDLTGATLASNVVSSSLTSVGTLGSLAVTGATTSGSFVQGTDYLSPYQGFRNKIINGDFGIWQRGGAGGYSPNSGTMEGADRWITWWNGTGGTRLVYRSTFALGQTAVPNNPKYHMTINTSVIGSGQTVTDFWQRIENVNTFAGQTATLSFWWKSTSAATQASPFITQNFGTGGSPSTAVETFLTTTSLASANTWTKYSVSVTLPSISGKTLGASKDHLFVGLRFLPTVACTIDISSVQLEQGSVSTPFEQRPAQTEFALCQRYYQTSYSNGVTVPTNNSQPGIVLGGAPSVANLAFIAHVVYPVTMRAAPTLNIYSYTSSQSNRVSDAYFGTDQGAISGNPVYSGSTGFSVYNTSGVTMTSNLGFMFHYAAQAEL